MDSSASSERHDGILSEANGEINGRKHGVLDNRPLQEKCITGPVIIDKQTVPPAADSPHGEGCRASCSTYTYRASQRTGELGAAPYVRTTRGTASSAVLELGAGTGICGMAASLSLGCPVTALQTRIKRCKVDFIRIRFSNEQWLEQDGPNYYAFTNTFACPSCSIQ